MTEFTEGNGEISNLDESFVWENRASLSNVPSEVMPVVEDLSDALKEIYGNENAGSFYLHGSVVSGSFRMGSSDIDGLWISETTLPEGHVEKRRQLLGAINLRDSVGYLDVIAMPAAEISDPHRRSSIFTCAFNGVRLYGNYDYDLTSYLPRTRADYITCMFAQFSNAIKIARTEGFDNDSITEITPRSIAKRVARSVFYDAYINGCPYEQSITEMREKLLLYGFTDSIDIFDRMLDLSKRALSDTEKQEILEMAELYSDKFMKIIKSNNSSYSLWVKNGLGIE